MCLQVLLIGVSRCPWDCDQKALAQTYNKMILIPRPDYGSLSFLWKELLFQFGGVSRQFDTAAMTKVCKNYMKCIKLINLANQIQFSIQGDSKELR
jgi:fatty acid synthase